MPQKKIHWFWNVLLVLTVCICSVALLLHYKNWVSISDRQFGIRSGFYHVSVPFQRLDSIYFVERIPPMERLHGFSALKKEKGVFRAFKDSLTDKKIYVFVDNIHQQKIKMVYKDSQLLFVNLKDSLSTTLLLEALRAKKESTSILNKQ